MALRTGIAKQEIIHVRRVEISEKVKDSIKEHEKKPALFHGIVRKAIGVLQKLIQRMQMPPRPVLSYDGNILEKLEQIRVKLGQIVHTIRIEEEITLPALERELKEAKGILKGKERKRISENINRTKGKVEDMRGQMQALINQSGFKNIQDFVSGYNEIKMQEKQYKQEIKEWRRKYGGDPVD